MSLTNKTIANTYKDVISIDNSNAGFDTGKSDAGYAKSGGSGMHGGRHF